MSKSFNRNTAKKAAVIRVKQSTIDNIKSMGMSAALKKAGSSKNAEFLEGVKRMYGAKRLQASVSRAKKSAPAKSPDAARASYAAKNKPAAKSADAARNIYIKGSGPKPKALTPKNSLAPKPKPMTPKYTSKNPKPMNPKGLFPGLLGGKKK